MTIIIARLVILLLAAGGGVAVGHALGLASPWPFLALAGSAVGLGVLLAERGFQRVPIERIVWGGLGALFGLVLGLGLGAGLGAVVPAAPGRGGISTRSWTPPSSSTGGSPTSRRPAS